MKTRFSFQYFALFALLGTIAPYMQRFLRAKGFSEAENGALLGVMALGACGPAFLGALADRVGRKRTMVVCTLLAAALLPVLAATDSPWLAAGLLLGIGLTTAMFIPLTDTLAANELPDPAHTYGRVRIWGSVGFVLVLAAAGGSGLIDEQSPKSMLTAMLLGAGLFVATSLGTPDRRRHSPDSQPAARGTHFDAVFYLFLFVGAMHQLGMSAHYSFFTNYAADVLKLPRGAWTWAIGSAAEIPFLFLGGWFVRKMGIGAMLFFASLAVTVRIGTYALFPFAAVALPIQVLHAPVFGLRHAASIEFLRRKVPPGRRGLAMALYMSLAISLPLWVGSTAGGLILKYAGYTTLYGAYALAPLLGAVGVLAAGKRFNVPPVAEEGEKVNAISDAQITEPPA
ncbi:MAG: MFS transporter [Planctomycetota bacterium]|nr:MFS transporter [Planctomycetota bacterium]